MSGFHSFSNILDSIMETFKPQNILEWGPGKSTEIMLRHGAPKILSIEHDKEYYDKMKERFPSIELLHLRINSHGNADGYVTYPLTTGELYDLVFVDGRHRCDCLRVASLVVKDHGIVVLHDAERPVYKAAYSMYCKITDHGHTAVLREPKLRIAR